jgi:4-amino-4-deoxy-L-arabinose transferase-like glycosyltransferase
MNPKRLMLFGLVVILAFLALINLPKEAALILIGLMTLPLLSAIFRRTFKSISLRFLANDIVVILSAALVIYGAVYLIRNYVYYEPGIWPMLIGMGLFGIAVGWRKGLFENDGDLPIPESGPRLRFRWTFLIAAFVLVFWMAWRSDEYHQTLHLFTYLGFWAAAILAGAVGIAGWDALKEYAGRFGASFRQMRKTWLLVALFFALGVLARGWDLEHYPQLMDEDEARFASEGLVIALDDVITSPFIPGVHSHPRLFHSLIGLSIKIFGDSIWPSRLPSVLLGALTVPAVFLLGRELFGTTTGIVAGLFMASFPLNVQISRIGFNQPGDPLFTSLSFLFFFRGLRRGKLIEGFLGGCMLAMSHYFYQGGLLGPLVLIAYTIFLFLRQREVVKRMWPIWVAFALGWVLAIGPHYFHLLITNQPITTRFNATSIFFTGQLGHMFEQGEPHFSRYVQEQIRASFFALIHTWDRGGWYGPIASIMGWFGVVPFVLGLGYALRRLFNPRMALLLGWIFSAILLGSVFAISPPQFHRYVVITPTLSLMVAVGAVAFTRALIGDSTRKAWVSLPVAAGILLMLLDTGWFWGVYVQEQPYLAHRKILVSNLLVAERQRVNLEQTQIIFINNYGDEVRDTDIMLYFTHPADVMTFTIDVNDIDLDPAGDYLFFISRERGDTLEWLQNALPGGEKRAALDESGTLLYYAYRYAPYLFPGGERTLPIFDEAPQLAPVETQ